MFNLGIKYQGIWTVGIQGGHRQAWVEMECGCEGYEANANATLDLPEFTQIAHKIGLRDDDLSRGFERYCHLFSWAAGERCQAHIFSDDGEMVGLQ